MTVHVIKIPFFPYTKTLVLVMHNIKRCTFCLNFGSGQTLLLLSPKIWSNQNIIPNLLCWLMCNWAPQTQRNSSRKGLNHPSNISERGKEREKRLCMKILIHKNHTKLPGERFMVTKCNRPTPIRFCQNDGNKTQHFFNLKRKTAGNYQIIGVHDDENYRIQYYCWA